MFRMSDVIVLSDSDVSKKQLTSALMKSKCTLIHEHAILNRLCLQIGMTDECLTNVCALIKNGYASYLEVLDLSVNQLTSSGISKICEIGRKLRCLNFGHNAIGDEGVGMICNALIQGQKFTLKKLFLDSCSLSEECLR